MSRDLLLLVGRILLVLLFFASGIQGLSDMGQTIGYFERLGLPFAASAAWTTVLFETLLAVLVVIGYETRLSALALGAFAMVASYLGHFGQGGSDPFLVAMHQQMLLKDIAVAGGLLVLAAVGAGRYSFDATTGRGAMRDPALRKDS